MKYTEISLEDMKQFLTTNGNWTEVQGSSSTQEYVYENMINENPKIVIQIFTSISKNDDSSRSKGKDAIRVFSVNLTDRKGWIKTIKVLRVQGWQHNLKTAISTIKIQSCERLSQSNIVKKFNPCWTKCYDGTYATEASTLDANKETYRRDVCPHCGHQYSSKNLVKILKDRECETQAWKFECPHCQSKLTVFND